MSSNVVSVLQAGAFFGALGSAPMSGAGHYHLLMRRLKLSAAKIGRRFTLLVFSVIFLVGAVRTLLLPDLPMTDNPRYSRLSLVDPEAWRRSMLAESSLESELVEFV